MLIRTKQFKCYRVAIIVRVILFLGIPSFYLLFGSDNTEQELLHSALDSGKIEE